MPSEQPVYCWFDFEYGWITINQESSYYSYGYIKTTDGLETATKHYIEGHRDSCLYGHPTTAIPLELFSILEDTS